MKRQLGITLILLTALAVASCETAGKLAFWRKDEKQKTSMPVFEPIGQHVLPETRRIELVCNITVDDIPRRTKEVRLWTPFPMTGAFQRVLEPTFSHPTSYRPVIRYDGRYGTRVLHVSGEAPLPQSFEVSWSARVDRTAVDHHALILAESLPDNEIRARFAPDLEQVHLAPLVGENLTPEQIAASRAAHAEALRKTIGEIVTFAPASDNGVTDDVAAALDAAQVAAKRRGALADKGAFARPRAVYDYVLHKLRPDTAASAGPQRTVKEILDAGSGDAADYALVTVALLRSAGIPARVETGILLDEDKNPDRGEVTARSAWVRFCVNGRVWSACDPYLGDRSPALADYMFGGLCANRVQLSAGPEPQLVPIPEAGFPVIFDDVIAEADGKPVNARLTFFFRDVAGGR